MLFEFKEKTFDKYDLLDTLQNIGIKHADTICVHSQLFNFGKPLCTRGELLENILWALCQSVGIDIENIQNSVGTLLMPVFTFSFCDDFNAGKKAIYDKKNSKTNLGILNEYFRCTQAVYRTNDPVCSYAILGKDSDKYKNIGEFSYGKNSVLEKLIQNNAKIVGLGSSCIGYTLFHYIEEQCQVPYRFYKTFSGEMIDENGAISNCQRHLYVAKEKDIKHDPYKLRELLMQKNIINLSHFGKGDVYTMSSMDFYTTLEPYVKNTPYFFTKRKEH